MPGGGVRLDQRLVDLGLAETRSRAALLIRAGQARLGDRVVDKPGMRVACDAQVTLLPRPRFVSRGGEKLAGALQGFGIDPSGWRCLDAGASTGGFTDCLLQHGARAVTALDVGYGQLAFSLRRDPRVRVVERTNLRFYTRPTDEPPYDLVTADLAFISLVKVLPVLAQNARPGGELVLLVKPQFELERRHVGKGGVVRDPEARLEAARRVRDAARSLGLESQGELESSLPGPKGNRERFVWLRRPGAA